jgi:hypothetical protein
MNFAVEKGFQHKANRVKWWGNPHLYQPKHGQLATPYQKPVDLPNIAGRGWPSCKAVGTMRTPIA